MSHPSLTTLRLLVAMAMLGLRLAPAELTSKDLDRLRLVLGRDLVSQADHERIDRGYYLQLLDARGEPGGAPPICQVVDDLREVVLRPSLSIVRDNGTSWSIMPTHGLCRLSLGFSVLPRISLLASFERADIIWKSLT